MNIPTPHISAMKGDFADTVLMPGDPLRAKHIAETFLSDFKLVTDVRGILGYTGYYKGKRVSVMASGMGCPSIGIYSYELFNGYDVKNIIRVGTACSLKEDLKIRDIVIAQGASYQSSFVKAYDLPGTYSATASYDLLSKASAKAEQMSLRFRVGDVFTQDAFYDEEGSALKFAKMGVLAVEMETAGLYMAAARANKNALTICTISDSLITNEETTSEERQTTFNQMIELALEIS